jgi:hypothetical protein
MDTVAAVCTNLAINPATHRRIWDCGKSGL